MSVQFEPPLSTRSVSAAGEGSFGSVYRCSCEGHQMAVKILSTATGFGETRGIRSRETREAACNFLNPQMGDIGDYYMAGWENHV